MTANSLTLNLDGVDRPEAADLRAKIDRLLEAEGYRVKKARGRRHLSPVRKRRYPNRVSRTYGCITVIRRGPAPHLWWIRCASCGRLELVDHPRLNSLATMKPLACSDCRDAEMYDRTVGLLTVRCKDHRYPARRKDSRWFCKCACGRVVSLSRAALEDGNTATCGQMACVKRWQGLREARETAG